MNPEAETITLRAARAEDALCLGVLGTQVFLDTYATGGIRPAVAREVLSTFSSAAMSAVLAQPNTSVIVAECAGHLLGFAQIATGVAQPGVHAAAPAELQRLYVQAPWQGRGLGWRLLQQAQELAAVLGADVMWLTHWVHNHPARAFYLRQGYVDVGGAFFVFEGESHENRVLALGLSGSAPGQARTLAGSDR